MKESDWLLKYAPYGYRYMKSRVSFDTLEFAEFPSAVLMHEMARLRLKLEREIDGRYSPTAFTRVTVYPKDIGESINHLDPLLPRFGIEIELRQPAAPETA